MPNFESKYQFFVSKPFVNICKFYCFINLQKIVTCDVSQEKSKENGRNQQFALLFFKESSKNCRFITSVMCFKLIIVIGLSGVQFGL